MIAFLENCKRFAGVMIALCVVCYIVALTVLQLLVSVPDGTTSKQSPQTPDEPPQSSSPCSVIDGLTICPEGTEVSL